MIKLKIGDKVKIHSLEYFEKKYNFKHKDSDINWTISGKYPGLISNMLKHCNKIYTIRSLLTHETFRVIEDKGDYIWSLDFCKIIKNNYNRKNTKIKININDYK